MENLKKIQKLLQDSNAIIHLYEVDIKNWKNDSRIDKYDWGFNKDSRFAAHKAISISFDTYSGEYGSSSCSRQLGLDDEEFAKHFKKILNEKQEEIMRAVAESMKAEATKYKEQAEKELKAQMDKLQELT